MRNATVWPASFLLFLLACADHRHQVANDTLNQEVTAQSGGALALTKFNKTNGYELERQGMRMHAIEWSAELLVARDVWKAGNGIVGYWSDFRVLPAQPVGLDAVAVGGARSFRRGSTVQLTGESVLHKADRGWRVFATTVKTAQVVGPVLAASEVVGEWSGRGGYTGHRLVIHSDYKWDYFMAASTYRGTVDPNGRLGDDDLENALRKFQFVSLATPERPLTAFENALVLNLVVDGKNDKGTFILCKIGDALQAWGGSEAYFEKTSSGA